MRKLIMLATVIFAAAGFATLTTYAPAEAAHGYPWCVQGWGVDIPGDCSYRTYAQCMASASGRNAWCAQNPAFAQGRHSRAYVPR